jgi:hypothetical protein
MTACNEFIPGRNLAFGVCERCGEQRHLHRPAQSPAPPEVAQPKPGPGEPVEPPKEA